MKSWTLVTRSLRFYWRTHLAVVLGVIVATAVLVGALVVGDSVQHTLRTFALLRLGKVQSALVSENRYFRAELADSLGTALDTMTAPVLWMNGIASSGDGSARVNSAQVLGVDERFWKLGSGRSEFNSLSGDQVIVSRRLADQLNVKIGDDVLLRVERISLLPRDAPMSIGEDFSVALRMTVKAVASDSDFGRFSLQASQIPPFNAFVPIKRLQERLELPNRANMLLVGDAGADSANAALQEHWTLADAGLELRELPEQELIELRTDRVFLDAPVVNAAKRLKPEPAGVLTYFVNELRFGDRTTPYSIVSAVEDERLRTSDMADDEILINTWLAEDLQARIGDMIELTYFIFGPMRKLEERSSSFRVRSILSIEGAASDAELMPTLPGLSDSENCRDWDPGIPIDLHKIREEDEEYWDLYRGTPKAFITLEAGQSMWSNRFGDLTALRYPMKAGNSLPQIDDAVKSQLEPSFVGLFFRPVGQQAMAASDQALDFGQLFLSLSFFLVVSALLLTGLLFVFGIQQRTEEMGTLLALGFKSHQVRRMFLYEGGVLAVAGGILGTCGGVLYTKVVLHALSTVWHGAVRTTEFYYHAEPISLVIGAAAGIAMALLTIWLTSFRQAKRPARELLTGELESRQEELKTQDAGRLSFPSFGILMASGSLVAAIIILAIVGTGRDAKAAAAFFGVGALLLIACLSLSHTFLTRRASRIAHHSITGMGMRNSIRRRGRSLATIGLLACGSFLVIAIGANRHNPMKDAEKRSSGTGGFAFYGESALPIFHDLNTREGREAYGLNGKGLESVEFVPFRVHAGDDASCLNLNRPQSPRLLGVKPEYLQERGAFTFAKTVDGSADPWLLLKASSDDKTVNAIGDANTIAWSVGKAVGDALMYTDERGQTFHVKIVGSVANSILQGGLIISEDEFIDRFPSESGYKMFLIDVSAEKSSLSTLSRKAELSDVSRTLSYAFQDVGMELRLTTERLADFNTLQNTYLSIFQSLGGLALLLGSLGLGIVVLRNVMERRSELALLKAVGFRNRPLQWLILSEHWLLLVLGLVCGVLAGLVAVLPALRLPGADIPYASLIVTIFAILVNGALWTWLATRLALRGPLLAALRNE